MTSHEVKEWLSRGFWLRQEKAQIVKMRQEVIDRLTNITQQIGNAAVSGTKDPHKFDVIAEFDLELKEKEEEIDKARRDIFKAIRSLPDRRLRVVMSARYLDCMKWPEIAEIMHYQERQVYRLHGKALAELAKTMDKRCH